MCVAQMKCLGNTIQNFTATMCVAHVCHPLLPSSAPTPAPAGLSSTIIALPGRPSSNPEKFILTKYEDGILQAIKS